MKAPIYLATLFMTIACAQQEYGECDAPRDNLSIVFKDMAISHSYCIVCDPELDPADYADWATEMGAAEGPASTEDVYPCLYVYPPEGSVIDTVSVCESLVCDGGANYSDMVGKEQGNVDLTSLLND